MYRTRIKPGQIDSGMWVLIDSESRIYETVGHTRLLDADNLDVDGPFMTCDSGGNRGQIDTICRNEPKPYIGCQNYVPPPSAAATLRPGVKPGANATAASAEECLTMYETLSSNKGSENLASLQKTMDAAGEFRARCKIGLDQQVLIDDDIGKISIRMDGIKRQISAAGNPDLLSQADAVKKMDGPTALKKKMVENLQSHISNGNLRRTLSFGCCRSGTIDVFSAIVDPSLGETLSISQQSPMNGSSGSETVRYQWDKLCIGKVNGSDRYYAEEILSIAQAPNGTCTNEKWFYFDFGANDENFIELQDLSQRVRTANKGKTPVESTERDDQEEGVNMPKTPPTTVAEYEKKVALQVKAAQPTVATPTRGPAPLTPKQKAACDAESQQKLTDLIQKDLDANEAEKLAEARRVGEEKRRVDEERQREVEKRKRVEQQRRSSEEEAQKRQGSVKNFV